MTQHKGLVQVYTGAGKGKTTAAFGLALRAMGQGLKVCIIQFLKSKEKYNTGESKMAEQFPNLDLFQFGGDCSWLCEQVEIDEKVKEEIKEGLNFARKIIGEEKYDLLILDEINVALDFGLIDLDEVLELIRDKPEQMELVLTGREAPKELVEAADLVTEMREVKHPYQKGVKARRGIEY